MTDISKHAFLKAIVDNSNISKDALKELAKNYEETGTFRTTKNARLPPAEFYHFWVRSYTWALLSALERMSEAQFYLQNLPRGAAFSKKGITEDKWIEYHYCNHLVILYGIYDTSLILTNFVFRLGLKEKDCKESTIQMNAWVRNTPVKAALDGVSKVVEPHRDARNLYVHRGEIPIIEGIDDLKVFSLGVQFGKFADDPKLLKALRKDYVEQSKYVVKDMNTRLDAATAAVEKLFDALLPVYEQQIRIFSITSKAKT